MDKEHSKIEEEEEEEGQCQERKEKQTEQMFWGREGGRELMVRGQRLYHGGGERLSPLG